MPRQGRLTVTLLAVGIVFVATGLLAIVRLPILTSLAILFIVAGVITMVGAAAGYRVGVMGLAFVATILLFTTLPLEAFMIRGGTTTYLLKAGEVSFQEFQLNAEMTAGNIAISYTRDPSIIYKVVVREVGIQLTKAESLSYRVEAGRLIIDVATAASSITVEIGSGLKGGLSLFTIAGNVDITVDKGEVLSKIVVKTNMGNIRADMKPKVLEGFTASSTIGNVFLALSTGEELGVSLSAKASLGNVVSTLRGYTILSKASGSLNAQTDPSKHPRNILKVDLNSNMGNIDIIANAE